MSQFLKFYFTSVLNMFRTLIYSIYIYIYIERERERERERESFKVFLKTKQTSLNAFSFRSCLYKYYPSWPTTPAWFPPQILAIPCRIKNRPFSLLKYSMVSVLYWHCSGRWLLRYSRIITGVCERVCKQHLHHCWLSYPPATEHSSG